MRGCNFRDAYPADCVLEEYHVSPSVHIQKLKNSWQVLMLGRFTRNCWASSFLV